MDSASIIPAEAYKYIYYIVIGIVGLNYYSDTTEYSATSLITRPYRTNSSIVVLFLFVIFFIGLRPISDVFSDMQGYAFLYNHLADIENKDPGLWWLAKLCKSFGFNEKLWFLVVCVCYYGFTLRATKLLSPNNWNYIFLTFLIAFSTLAYATNGIRNGLAMASLTFGMAIYFKKKGKGRFFSLLFFLFAYYTHKSSFLPLFCFFFAYYFIHFKSAVCFWILSVFISIFAGNSVSNFFIGLGFDDRLDGYITGVDYSGFSHAGFRWDFLLYSVMPIILGYYILIMKGFRNRVYEVLLSTYVLANAFWIMVIKAQFSDRFAYLSWFLYAIIVAYPLFSIDIWGNKQGRVAKNILYVRMSFTIFMNLIYYTFIKTII